MRGGGKSIFDNVTTDQVIICVLLVVLVVLVIYYVNQNTNEGFEGDRPVLYLFYVDWCPHCKTAKPKVNELKKELNNKKINKKHVDVELVNCEENKELAKQFNVRAYPTVYLVVGEEKVEFNKAVTKENLKEFLNNNV